jgi:hypothetical protein
LGNPLREVPSLGDQNEWGVQPAKRAPHSFMHDSLQSAPPSEIHVPRRADESAA